MLGLRRCLHHPGPLLARRRFWLSTEEANSGSVVVREEIGAVATTTSSATPTTTTRTAMVELERHGPGDGCLTLNVGGTEFYTLRSTVQSNAVLALHVARAEANKEILKDGAVFIDRDPKYFGLILSYLRNTLENLDATRLGAQTAYVSMTANTMAGLQLPKDAASISEVYVEACFYDIGPMKEKLLSRSFLANIICYFYKDGSGNPFEMATKLASRLRTVMLALGATGGTIFVSLQEDYEWLARKVGLKTGTDDADKNIDAADHRRTAVEKAPTIVPDIA
jgi:hypothetical protein